MQNWAGRSVLLLLTTLFLSFAAISNNAVAGPFESGIVGLRLIESRLEVLTNSASAKDGSENEKIQVTRGDSLLVVCAWQVTDIVDRSLKVQIDLRSIYGRVLAVFPLGLSLGRDSAGFQIGERIEERYRIGFFPGYERIPDYHEESEEYHMQVVVRAASFTVSYLQKEDQPVVRLLHHALPDQAKCVTGNSGFGGDDLARVQVLAPMPILHNQSHAGTVESELTDGLTSGSANYNWESVIWRRVPTGRILVEFERPVDLEAVIVASPHPYPNVRVGRMTVETVQPDGEKMTLGTYMNKGAQEVGKLQILSVFGQAPTCRKLVIHLYRADTPGITEFAASELYIWGSPSR
ncbi:MAG TPA: hypothetical protein DIU35_08965 [Candidatus Latescibacteria bacterium]|nr:hypothetical protein [Gemmatimonadota bacterium]HCR17602.1 hypothetical protein [Candidatus Latescibacterota bacterium]|tara:strand:+ start:1190 stop:2239 length:1050 start_codon:yes stop_codon:yes gene_type:complete